MADLTAIAVVGGRGAAAATMVTAAAQGWRFAIGIASTIILARLLGPSDFGVFAMAAPIVGFVGLFQDFGLGRALIQQQILTRVQLESLFWFSILAAAVGTAVLVAAAPAMAAFYDEPRLVAVQVALAFSLLVGPFVTQPTSLLLRQARFSATAAVDAGAATIGFVCAILLAALNAGVWALVGGALAGSVAAAVAAALLTRWFPGRPVFRREARKLVAFGAGVFIYDLSNFISRYAHAVVIGFSSGAVQLGYYDRASRLLLAPLQQVSAPLNKVALPSLARLTGDPAGYRKLYLGMLRVVLTLTQPVVVVVIIAANEIIPAVLGEGWSEAAAIFAVLGLSALHQPATMTLSWLFQSQARTVENARIGVGAAAATVLAMVVGSRWGALGVAIAYVAVDSLVRAPALWCAALRTGPVAWRDATPVLATHAIAVVGAAAAQIAVRSVIDPSGLRLIAEAGAAGTAYLSLLLALSPARALLHDLKGLVRRGDPGVGAAPASAE